MTTTSMNLTDVEDHLDGSKEITAGIRTTAGSVVRLEDQCINACDGAPSASATLASISLLDLWANNDQDLRTIWSALGEHGGRLNSSALSSITGLDVPDGTYSPLDDALFSLDVIRDLLDTAREDDDKNKGVGAADADQIWSTNDLQAMIDNDDGYYTDAQVAHAKKVMALIEVSPDAREYLGITESGGGWSFSDIGHLTLDVFGMVPVIGNAADGINAAWYMSEGKYLDAALSSIALIPGIGQAATLAKPAIKAAAAGVAFKSLDEALTWARKWLDEAGILGRNSDEAAGAAASQVDNVFRSNGDPMRALQGPGVGTPEWDAVVKELEDMGVAVEFRPGAIAYDAPVSGGPGTVIIDPDASLSALRHEALHVADDAANGFPGLSHYMQNPGQRWQMEQRAYDMEIGAARAAGADDIAQELIELKALEHQALVDRFNLDIDMFPLE